MGFMAHHNIIKGGTPHITWKRRIKVLGSYVLLNMAFLEDIIQWSCKLQLYVSPLCFSQHW